MRLIQLGHVFIVFVMMLYPLSSSAQLSVNIGINLPVYPELVVVPGYPVYYAPQLEANFFFYDGMYWVYQSDNWYTSSWYNGPWWPVSHMEVPLFVLRPRPFLSAGGLMHPRAGVSAGGMTGRRIEVVGTDGIAAQLRRLPRCRFISVNIQGAAIRNKFSNSERFNSSIIIFSRVILLFVKMIGRSQSSLWSRRIFSNGERL
jgi:hypothetical protein